ncbi:MAG: NAD(P)-dependent oxidoreductase [Deltaproteobacteria bacterium]|nr:NAD(P)-dependent oxidoreductase [Deltaproteobacteria bacterium]
MQSKDNLETPITNNKSRITALVTGATGFVGSHLVRRLIKDSWEAHIITRSSSNLKLLEDVAGKVIVHQHNGTTSSMINIVKEAEPGIVFHLASLFLAQHISEDIEHLVQSNLLFGVQLAEAMTLQGVTKLINTGTSWQHYENEDYNPVCLYAATKQAFKDMLKFYVKTSELKVITLKLFDTYGPDDPRPKLFTLLRKVAEGQTKLAMSQGEQLIDLVYIDDVIDGYLQAARRLLDNKVSGMEEYAISSGNPISLKDLVTVYGRIVKKPMPINWGGRPYRFREVMVPWNKGKNLPGWKPKVGLIEGIKRMEKTEESPQARPDLSLPNIFMGICT